MCTLAMTLVSDVNDVNNVDSDGVVPYPSLASQRSTRSATKPAALAANVIHSSWWSAAAVAGGAALAVHVLRRGYLQWGATDAERTSHLPGHELLPQADLVITRAITVHAATERVWPWVAQLGQAQGGFDSYDRWPGHGR